MDNSCLSWGDPVSEKLEKPAILASVINEVAGGRILSHASLGVDSLLLGSCLRISFGSPHYRTQPLSQAVIL